ncbi:MAG: DUF4364 family protein [Eubacteriales bacterium]
MSSLLKEDSQIKIFILYLMHNIGYPATYSDLQDAAGYGDYVAGLDFAQFFGQLQKDGTVESISDEEIELFRLTHKGELVVENLQHLLPFSVRDRGLKMALRLLQFKKTGATISHSMKEEGSGYRFDFSISENGADKIRLSVLVPQKETAIAMDYTVEQRPEVVYRGIMAMLTGDIGFI